MVEQAAQVLLVLMVELVPLVIGDLLVQLDQLDKEVLMVELEPLVKKEQLAVMAGQGLLEVME